MPKRDSAHMTAQRERILQAALACISAHGVEGTSIEHIRKAAGLSTGTLYRYFANKEDLVVAALEHFSTYETAVPVPKDWAEYRDGLMTEKRPTGLTSAELDSAMLHLMAGALSADYLRAAIRPVIERNLAEQRQVVEALVKAGGIEITGTPEQTVRAVAAVGIGMSWLAALSGQSAEAAAEEAAGIIDRLVKPR